MPHRPAGPVLLRLLCALVLLEACGSSGPDEELCAQLGCAPGACVVQSERTVCRASGTAPLSEEERVRAEAVAIAVGTTNAEGSTRRVRGQEGVFSAFSFTAQAGQKYRFRCESLSLPDCRVFIHNGLWEAVSLSFDATSTQVEADLRASDAGPYYVSVSSSDRRGVGSFRYSLLALGPDDRGVPGMPGLEEIALGSPRAGVLEQPRDFDGFSFPAAPGHIYRFACQLTDEGQTGVVVSLWAPGSGHAPQRLLQEAAYTEPRSELFYEAETQATRFPVIQGNWTEGTQGGYQCQLDDLGLDDHGDSAPSATPITVSEQVVALFDTREDVDAFVAPLQAGHYYRARCAVPHRCDADPFDPDGQLTYADEFLAEKTGPYTFLLEAAGWSGADRAYVFGVEDLGEDEHGNTPQTATQLQGPPQSFTGTLQASNDVDSVSFPLAAGRIAHLACESALAGASAPNLSLFDPSGRQADEVNNYAGSAYAVVSVEAAQTGRYVAYLSRASNDVGTRSYRCTLEDGGTDDHGDSAGTATAVAVPSTTAAERETRTDVDFLSVWLVAGRSVSITCAEQCHVSVRDASGAVLTPPSDSPGVYQPAQSGTYFLEVLSNSGKPGLHSVQVSDLGP